MRLVHLAFHPDAFQFVVEPRGMWMRLPGEPRRWVRARPAKGWRKHVRMMKRKRVLA